MHPPIHLVGPTKDAPTKSAGVSEQPSPTACRTLHHPILCTHWAPVTPRGPQNGRLVSEWAGMGGAIGANEVTRPAPHAGQQAH